VLEEKNRRINVALMIRITDNQKVGCLFSFCAKRYYASQIRSRFVCLSPCNEYTGKAWPDFSSSAINLKVP
jgi:hypothetical protein